MTPPTQSNATHTATPWTASGLTIYAEPERRSFGGPIREYLCPVAQAEPGETDEPEYMDMAHGADYNERLPGYTEAHGNAQLIVRAVNNHARLVEALDGAIFNMDDTLDHLERLYDSSNPYVAGLRHSIAKARAALANLDK